MPDGAAPTTELRVPLADITPHPSARPRKANVRAWRLAVNDPRFGPADLPFDVSDLAGERILDQCAIFDSRPAVRPTPDGPTSYGGIFGERRMWRALLDGCASILVTVHDVDAETAERMHLRENMDRADLPPLAEAREIARYREGRTYGIDEVADHLGKSPRYVRQRLSLLQLVPAAQELLDAGRITPGLALKIAPLAPASQQGAVDALKALGEGKPGEEIGVREAGYIVARFLCGLANPPFPAGDASLPGGACTTCPKRSSAQAALFPEGLPHGDECLDHTCYRRKEEAWKAKTTSPALEGKRRLPVVEEHEDDARDLGETEGLDDDRDPKPANLPKAKPKGSAAEDARTEAEADQIADERALEAIGKKAGRLKSIDEKALRLLCVLAIRSAHAMSVDMVLALRQIDSEKALVASLAGLYEADLRAVLWMVLAGDDRRVDGEESALDAACRWAKVDRAALRVEALADVKAKRIAHTAPPKPADVACTCGKPPGQKGRHRATCAKNAPAATAPAEPPCPITAEHVATIAAELEIKDPHPGAVNPANVWSCAEKILAFMQAQQPEIDVPRAKILKAHESYGYDCADIAAQYLVREGKLSKKIASKKGGWVFRLVVAQPQP